MFKFILVVLLSFFILGKVEAVETPRRTTKSELPSRSHKFSFDCAKKYCKHMNSCAEACYKLLKCDHQQLDRDNDGIPCENVCRSPCKKNG